MADSSLFYTYKPIDLSTDAIRILRLCRGYDTDPINCELIEIFLQDDDVPFEALSYTWGNSTVDVYVLINGRKKPVRRNLYTALHCLRRASEDRWLWVDALCIDQADDLEKTHQVGQMRRIYEKADRVLIWLGRATEDIDLLMDLMVQLTKRARRRKSYRKNEPTAWLEEWPILIKELGGMATGFNTRRRNALLSMLSRSWFHRVWILQVFNAKRASILCGWNEIATEVFVMMPRLMCVRVEERVQSVLDIMPGYLRRVSWRKDEPDLRTLLGRFNESEATDARDKIYALLGMASDAGSDGKFQPNYAITLGEAIRHAIFYLVFGESSGNICPLPDWGFNVFIQHLRGLTLEVFHWAIDYGKEITVRDLLTRTNVDINCRGPGGRSPLISLARQADLSYDLTKMFLARDNIDINIQDDMGNTALHMATMCGNTILVNELLAHQHINPNQYNAEFKTPLCLAVDAGLDVIVQALLQQGADIQTIHFKYQDTALYRAVKMGYARTVEVLLKHSVDTQAWDTRGENTALYTAAQRGDVATMQVLLEYGVDTKVRDSNWNTALFVAVQGGHASTVEVLLQYGADVEARGRDNNGTPLWIAAEAGRTQTALCVAAAMGHLHTVQVLLEYGADTEVRDSNWNSALFLAVQGGHVSTVEALLQHGADVEARDRNNNGTPLWIAAEAGHTQIFKLLLDKGAALDDGKDVKGRWSVLWVASRNGHVEIVRRIIEVAPPEFLELKDEDGEVSALYVAAERGNPLVVAALLDAGADMKTRDRWDRKPLWVAIKNFWFSAARQLVDRGARVEPGDSVQVDEDWFVLDNECVVEVLSKAGMNMVDIKAAIARANGEGKREDMPPDDDRGTKRQRVNGASEP
ncbi:ankyrin repeat-containing domain protein [Lasiosphaeris hirsuta]|uniref:Ankyrin repeat-containing domain protein n=1 Tax=Lasiosphaeris hirsuta TaxID=260670 RepID=A0AA40ANV7_9PEZI|nr:ankyrin repeat-containing domain protein [Lasiosphaeris hirsuta]